MALSANIIYRSYVPGRYQPEVVDAEILYGGAYVSIAGRTDGTAANRGRAEAFNDVAGAIPVGWSQEKVTGDTDGSESADGTNARARIDGDSRVQLLPVTGLAGTEDDTMRVVYASDDGTFTLTRPAVPAIPMGVVAEFKDSTDAHVESFTARELMILQLAGGNGFTLCLGSIVAEGGASNVDLLKGYVMPFGGWITDYYIICASAPADADVAGPITLEVDGTDLNFVTTNVLIGFADTLGLKVSGVGGVVAVSVAEGSLLDVESDFTAAGTVGDGIYNVYVVGYREIGL